MEARENGARVVAAARALLPLDADPAHPEAYGRYVELIAPGETPEVQREMAGMAGSALVVAGILRGLSVAGARLDPPYVMGTAVSRLLDLADESGAWVPFSEGEGASPSPGDVVIAGRSTPDELAYVVTSISHADGVTLDSIEGGSHDTRRFAVIAAGKHAWKSGRDVVLYDEAHVERSAPERKVDGWIDVNRLSFAPAAPAEAAGATREVSFGAGDGPRRRKPDRTPASARDMFAALSAAWEKRFNAVPRPESVYILVAQWALETGWGKYMHAFNIGNIKSVESDGRDYTYFACDEFIGGKHVWFYPDQAGCRFRAYETLEDGAVDYLETIYKHYQTAWSAVEAGDPAAYAHLLKLRGYYTASEETYTKTMKSVFNTIKQMLGTAAGAAGGPDLSTALGVQQALQKLGYDPGALDGRSGPRTVGAVQFFQRSSGLVADGIVGSETRAALAEALAGVHD